MDIMTKERMRTIVKEEIFILEMKKLHDNHPDMLEEGIWDSIKFGLSKLGRVTKGGKFFTAKTQEQNAIKQLSAVLDKQGMEMIKKLKTDIESKYPNFPNNKDRQEFLDILSSIGAVYDSIVAGTKIQPNAKGYVAPALANEIIKNLRMYVQYLLDYKLSQVYQYMEDVENDDTDVLDEKADENPLSGGQDSASIKAAKSNKLVIALITAGFAAVGAAWLLKTPGFQEWLMSFNRTEFIPGKEGIPDTTKQVTSSITKKFTDVTTSTQNIDPKYSLFTTLGNLEGLGPDAAYNPQTAYDICKKYGWENVAQLCGTPGTSVATKAEVLKSSLTNLIHAGKSSVVYNASAQFGGPILDTNVTGHMFDVTANTMNIKSNIIRYVTKNIIKTVTTKGTAAIAGGTIAKSVAGTKAVLAANAAAAVLLPLGIGLIATGVIVKLLRMKGLKQSRMKNLNDVLQNMKDVEDASGVDQALDNLDASGQGGANGQGQQNQGGQGQSGNTDQIYNQTKQLFKMLVNNKKRLADGKIYKISDILFEQYLLNESNQIPNKKVRDWLISFNGVGKDKVIAFEDLMTKLYVLNNTIKKFKTDDKVLTKLLSDVTSKGTVVFGDNFKEIFNVSDDVKDQQSLKFFIKQLFKSIYSSQYKFGPMMDKLKSYGLNDWYEKYGLMLTEAGAGIPGISPNKNTSTVNATTRGNKGRFMKVGGSKNNVGKTINPAHADKNIPGSDSVKRIEMRNQMSKMIGQYLSALVDMFSYLHNKYYKNGVNNQKNTVQGGQGKPKVQGKPQGQPQNNQQPTP